MIGEWRIGLLAATLLLSGMRDPFQPPEDKCAVAELVRWRYGGAAGYRDRLTGFIQDAGGKWRRVTAGMRLERGWTVLSIEPERMEIAVGEQCDPSRWHWLKEGAKHDRQKDSGGRSVDNGLSGRSGEAHLANGG